MDVWDLAADLGLTVVESSAAHRSGYWPDERLIHLRRGMSSRTVRSVLAHEIAHHVLGHLPTLFGPIRNRQERQANEWAADYLIDRQDYIEVEYLREGHVPSMAFDLDVAPELVVAYQSLIRRDLVRVA